MASETTYSFVSHDPTSPNVDMRAPVATTKKISRPRKTKRIPDENSVDKKERRRQQILLAQRAYRARSEANTKALQKRVARLESALEQTSQAIISFTDLLVGPQPPVSHQEIARHLRDTVKTCLNSALYGADDMEDATLSRSNTPEIPQETHASPSQRYAAATETQQSPLNDHASCNSLPQISLLPSMPDNASVIESSLFIKHLRITCLYQGFLLLKNPSVPLEALKRPFRLLLPLVTRETMASYFHTRLNARMNNMEPEPCSSIPRFGLGGAGSHYPNGTVQDYLEWESRPQADDALSAFSPEAQQDLDGEWFDLFDLLGFLRAHGTTFSTTRPVEYTAHNMVNAVDFTAALIGKGICLGHSPGFRRSDVEFAINASSWK